MVDENKLTYRQLVKRSFVQGLSWSFGVTVGFVFISTVLVFALQLAGGLPLIGNLLASLVEATLEQLSLRTPAFLPR